MTMLTLDELTDEQWAEVQNLTVQMLQSKQFGDDILRTCVYAFIEWMSHQDFDLASEAVPPKMKH